MRARQRRLRRDNPITQSATGSAAGRPNAAPAAALSDHGARRGAPERRRRGGRRRREYPDGRTLQRQAAILIVVFKSPGANVISAVDNVLALVPKLAASIPLPIKIKMLRSIARTTIRAS